MPYRRRAVAAPVGVLLAVLSAIVFLDALFSAVVAPLLPHYVREFELSKLEGGILNAAFPAGLLLGSLPTGPLTARHGPRRVLLAGLGLLTVATLVFISARHAVLLDVARGVQGWASAMIWTAVLAWVAAESTQNRGASLGLIVGAGTAGTAFGPAVGALAHATSPAVVFGAIPLTAAALALTALALSPHGPPARDPRADANPRLAYAGLALSGALVVVPSMALGLVTLLGALRLDAAGAAAGLIALTFVAAACAEAAATPISGRVSDRRGPLPPLRIALAASVPAVLLVGALDVVAILPLAVVASALAVGIAWAPGAAMLSEAAEAAGWTHGTAMSLFNLAWAAGQMMGALLGGALASAAGDMAPCVVYAALAAATVTAAPRLARRLTARP